MRLHGLLIVVLVGCSSSLQPSGGTGGGGGTGGSPATGGISGSAGAPGTGGSGPVSCGSTICVGTEFCCNPLCNVCAPVGSLCDLGCPVDAGGIATGTCASLAVQYAQAIVAAQACTVGSSGACTQLAHAALADSECGCNFTYVNDASQANAIYQTWVSLGCQPKSLCGGSTCLVPSPSGICGATDGGTAGVCNWASPSGA